MKSTILDLAWVSHIRKWGIVKTKKKNENENENKLNGRICDEFDQSNDDFQPHMFYECVHIDIHDGTHCVQR